MRLADFDYHLPKELIAQQPGPERDQSRLMLLDRQSQTMAHHRFFELPELLDPDSVLVFNESKVIPARLLFKIGNAKAEILLIKPIGPKTWECMVRPGAKFRPGVSLRLDPDLIFSVEGIMPEGLRRIRFESADFKQYLRIHGQMPTPPYIKEKLQDPERYQTLYARSEGSVAAPTAGLHFTQNLLSNLKAKGIGTEFVTLHVGLGTFQPVKIDNITEHKLHSEWFELTAEAATRLNQAKAERKRIVAVGTTALRVLESCADSSGRLTPRTGETSIFIYPGYRFKFVDQIITNFHLPKSTLLMLVSAFARGDRSGRDLILQAYELAKREHYRFFSFGDAMFIR